MDSYRHCIVTLLILGLSDVCLLTFSDPAGLVKIFLWILALGCLDVLFAKQISLQVRAYLLTQGLSFHLHQSHGKGHSFVQLVGGRKMPWKGRDQVDL
uniref:Protein phosphatase n=1 Tax=Solanum tuberosum TaxID=4113 RepID=M1CB62_SOLTU